MSALMSLSFSYETTDKSLNEVCSRCNFRRTLRLRKNGRRRFSHVLVVNRVRGVVESTVGLTPASLNIKYDLGLPRATGADLGGAMTSFWERVSRSKLVKCTGCRDETHQLDG